MEHTIFQNNINYVIVQAGGAGTRMGKYTLNKPKCLLPVNGKTLLRNVCDIFKGKKIIVIGQYKVNVLKEYINLFCSECILVNTEETGTSGGIKAALEYVPENEPFILTWSDLYFENKPNFSFDKEMCLGLTNKFTCRWRFNTTFENILA